jgi:hypothetical protein
MAAKMPRPDAAAILAKDLHNLPHPDGKRLVLVQHHPIAKTPEVQARMAHNADMIGEALIHKLERNGYTVTHKDDPKAADAEGYKLVKVKCLICGKQVMTIGVDHDMNATMGKLALQTMTQLNPVCPHE